MMKKQDTGIRPSNIVMEEYVPPAIEYYREMLDKITPYFFHGHQLVKLIGIQQLIVSREYQVKRDDARSARGIDYVRECVTRIQDPVHLLDMMDAWAAFDLCLSAPSFRDPGLGTQVRKSFCRVGRNLFDCENCQNAVCRENLLWEDSSLVFDIDTDEKSLRKTYDDLTRVMESLSLPCRIKLSSLKGLHMNVGLPRHGGTTLFDRSVCQFCLLRELKEQGIPVDDNSLDPVPIIRAPYSLHYKRLTPSLPVDDETFDEAVSCLQAIENEELADRIPRSLETARDWDLTWEVSLNNDDLFEDIFKTWKEPARKAILRETRPKVPAKPAVGTILAKGREMTDKDRQDAFRLLMEAGKTDVQAQTIIGQCITKGPKTRKISNNTEGNPEIIPRFQHDIPRYIMNIPPPLVLLLIDNATLLDMQHIAGALPVPVRAECTNTDEGMKMIFQDPKLLQRYSRRWNCHSYFIGGLYSSFKYCSGADTVLSVKTRQVWDRDMKVLMELEKVLQEGQNDFIAVHLLGLDYCKDNNMSTEGALLVFRRIIKAISATEANVVLITDHSGEEMMPFFSAFVHKG
ncbi:MAG: hypothetical protein WC379_17035 [Methanoregula sp.]|jgi:hypothetical protein